jgi:hypothetical protein
VRRKSWKKAALAHSMGHSIDLFATEADAFIEVAIAGTDEEGRAAWFDHVSGIRTFPGRFDDNRGTTRTCIDCRGVPGALNLSGRSRWCRRVPRREPEFRDVMATTWQRNLAT